MNLVYSEMTHFPSLLSMKQHTCDNEDRASLMSSSSVLSCTVIFSSIRVLHAGDMQGSIPYARHKITKTGSHRAATHSLTGLTAHMWKSHHQYAGFRCDWWGTVSLLGPWSSCRWWAEPPQLCRAGLQKLQSCSLPDFCRSLWWGSLRKREKTMEKAKLCLLSLITY